MIKRKFPLKCNGKNIRSIEELREAFVLKEMMTLYEDGSLTRWLACWGYAEELAAVKAIDLTERSACAYRLASIFNVSVSEDDIQTLFETPTASSSAEPQSDTSAEVSGGQQYTSPSGTYRWINNKLEFVPSSSGIQDETYPEEVQEESSPDETQDEAYAADERPLTIDEYDDAAGDELVQILDWIDQYSNNKEVLRAGFHRLFTKFRLATSRNLRDFFEAYLNNPMFILIALTDPAINAIYRPREERREMTHRPDSFVSDKDAEYIDAEIEIVFYNIKTDTPDPFLAANIKEYSGWHKDHFEPIAEEGTYCVILDVQEDGYGGRKCGFYSKGEGWPKKIPYPGVPFEKLAKKPYIFNGLHFGGPKPDYVTYIEL